MFAIFLLLGQSENDLGTWTATILGPPDSPFEDHLFKLRLTVPNRYPLMPPKAHFLTKVCHPNVHFKVSQPRFQIEVSSIAVVQSFHSENSRPAGRVKRQHNAPIYSNSNNMMSRLTWLCCASSHEFSSLSPVSFSS